MAFAFPLSFEGPADAPARGLLSPRDAGVGTSTAAMNLLGVLEDAGA